MTIDSVNAKPVIQQQNDSAAPVDQDTCKPAIDLVNELIALAQIQVQQASRVVFHATGPHLLIGSVREMLSRKDQNHIAGFVYERIAVTVRALMAEPT